MKAIFTQFLIVGIIFLQNVSLSQPITGVVPQNKTRQFDNFRDEKMKELLKSRIKKFPHSQINTNNQLNDATGTPDWNWALALGGSGGASGSDIVFDASNNYYVIGDFNGIVNFGSVSKTSSGLWDIFLAKYNSTGSLVWVKQISAETFHLCNSVGISLDGSNNIYISGYFNNLIHFDSFAMNSSGGLDAFIAKYDNSGNFIWAKCYGTASGDETVAGMVTDSLGNSYVAGNAPDGQFLVKYNTDGQYLWKTHSSAHALDIAYNNSGIFLTGYIKGTTTFGSFVLNPSSNDRSLFISKQDFSGTFTQANYIEGIDGGESYGTSIVVDISGNVYAGGCFGGTISFIPSTISLISYLGYNDFVAMYDASGICHWATPADINNGNYNFQIFPDENYNIYLSGVSSFDFTFGSSSLNTPGNFLAKMDNAGNPLWAFNNPNTTRKARINGNEQIIQTGADAFNFFISSGNLSGVPQWSDFTTSNGGSDDCWYTMSADSSGNSYLQGHFSGKPDFLGNNNPGNGIYLAKISGDLSLKWVKKLTVPSTRQIVDPSGIISDKFNNIYAWGTFSDSLTLEGTLITNPNVNGTIGYLAKYDKDGTFKWVRTFSCTSYMVGTGGIATDAAGNVVFTGDFFDALTIGSYTLTTLGGNSFFAKYSSNGEPLLAKTFSGPDSQLDIWARSIACDNLNNIFIAGQYSGTINFGTTSLTTLGGHDIFLVKYDPSGNELWAKDAGSSSTERASAVATDKDGNTYITGYFHGQTATFDGITISSPYPGGSNLYVAKYDVNGTCLWAHALQSPAYTWPVYQLSVDQNGNCYVGGDYADSLRFDNGPILTGNADSHFLARYNPNGDFEWSQNLTCTFTGSPDQQLVIFAISAVNDKSIYIAGLIQSDVLTFGATPISSTSRNGFLALLGKSVGIPDIIQAHNGVTLFPNPATNTIYLEFDKQSGKPVSYSISDLNGKTIISRTAAASKRIKIDLPDLSKGVYLISIRNELGEYSRKFVID